MNDRLFDLSGRVAVVTGAGANGGIGHAIALGLAQFGAAVVAADIDEQGALQTDEEIRNAGGRSLAVRCDVLEREQVDALFVEVDRAFGKIDILVNNACVSRSRVHPDDLALEAWERTLRACLTGYFLCSQHAIRRMLKQGTGGSIVNISSVMSLNAYGRGNLPYSVAKSGVNQLTRELAVEYGEQGIRVNAVLPAQVNTPPMRRLLDDPHLGGEALRHRVLNSIPLNRIIEPNEFVGPIVFLCSDAGSAITGALLPVDGGNLAMNAGADRTWPKVS